MNIANEPPSTTLSGVMVGTHRWADGSLGAEWDIGPYQVCVRWNWPASKPIPNTAMLQICRADGGSVVDWRHLQQIKNIACDPEWTAVEIFPPESKLKDPSNARYLWACKDPLSFGLPGGRCVLDSHEAIAPQRPLAIDAANERGTR